MAKLNIIGYEERQPYGAMPCKHYKVNVALVTSDGNSHETFCLLAKEPESAKFDFTCFEDADIDEFDFRNKWRMSEQVISWAERNIKEGM